MVGAVGQGIQKQVAAAKAGRIVPDGGQADSGCRTVPTQGVGMGIHNAQAHQLWSEK